MNDIKPEHFGSCAETRCIGRCPYRDQELIAARASLPSGMRPEGGKSWSEKVVHVLLQPEERYVDVPRAKAKNVAILLKTLELKPMTAIVACGDMLLTPDTPLYPEQHVLVRTVMSRG